MMTMEEQNAELSKIYDSIPQYEPTDEELQKMYNNFKRNNTIMRNKTKKGLVTSPKTVTNNLSLNIAKDNAAKLRITDEVDYLIKHQNERIRVSFTKKDNSTRWINFVPNTKCDKGKKAKGNRAVITKAERGMITVAEIYKEKDKDGKEFEDIRPRTVNLTTLIDYFVVGSEKEVA